MAGMADEGEAVQLGNFRTPRLSRPSGAIGFRHKLNLFVSSGIVGCQPWWPVALVPMLSDVRGACMISFILSPLYGFGRRFAQVFL